VDVIGLFMALLSFRGISTPSLQAQGEQRRSSYFNNDRDIARVARGHGLLRGDDGQRGPDFWGRLKPSR
jgi:hypothetical protein